MWQSLQIYIYIYIYIYTYEHEKYVIHVWWQCTSSKTSSNLNKDYVSIYIYICMCVCVCVSVYHTVVLLEYFPFHLWYSNGCPIVAHIHMIYLTCIFSRWLSAEQPEREGSHLTSAFILSLINTKLRNLGWW